jgi:hypothetical protein
MATNKVLDLQGASAALTITLAGLASSATGVGRQSTLLANPSASAAGDGHRRALVFFNVKLGTSPTANKSVQFYLIRGDNIASGTQHIDDQGGASDAAITIKNAQCVFVAQNISTTTGEIVQGSFAVENMGPDWGIAVVHDTGVNLDSAAGNHWIRCIYVDDDIQAAS